MTMEELVIFVVLGRIPHEELDVLKWLLVSHQLVNGSYWTMGCNGDVAVLSESDCENPL